MSRSIAIKGQAVTKRHAWLSEFNLGPAVNYKWLDRRPFQSTLFRKQSGLGRQFISWSASATRLGWDQARLVGINIGPADVPVSVTNGQLATAAEIPVSGGVVRWEVGQRSNFADMIIYQKADGGFGKRSHHT